MTENGNWNGKMWQRMKMVTGKCDRKWKWSQENVTENENCHRKMWQKMKMVTGKCDRKW